MKHNIKKQFSCKAGVVSPIQWDGNFDRHDTIVAVYFLWLIE